MSPKQIDRYPKGKKRIESLLNAARQILIKKGYGGFTIRNIAKQAGTTVGNLQYFFPNKNKLFHDLLEYTVHDFFIGFEKIAADESISGEEKLAAYINSIYDAFPNEGKTKLFPEFWALSNHNKNVAKFLEEMYERGLIPLTSIIREINPELSKKQVREVAIAIVGCTEGSLIFVGYQRPWTSSFEAVREITLLTCLHMARSYK